MSNDWMVIPATEVNWSAVFREVMDNEPHSVVWTFPTKAAAQSFAVKAEYINEHGINLSAASIFLDSMKAMGTDDPTRVALASVAESVMAQLKLNNALALLEQACNGDLALFHKVRALVEKIG